MASPQSDDQVLEQAIALSKGDERAKRKAVKLLDDQLGRRLEGYFVRHKVLENDAEELVWDTWYKILDADFRCETRPVVWLWTIARNQMYSYHRKDRPEIGLADEDWLGLIETTPALSIPPWVKLCIERALLEFERDHPERAEVLRMLGEEWSAREVGEFLGCTEGAARDRIYRTREKVRPYLEECKEST